MGLGPLGLRKLIHEQNDIVLGRRSGSEPSMAMEMYRQTALS